MKLFFRVFCLLAGFIALWQTAIYLFDLPSYILPTPWRVLSTLHDHFRLILNETKITLIETGLGLMFGTLLGAIAALIMASCRSISVWVLPLLVVSQAIPTFAVAPLLVIWFGYGMTSKIATAILMIFFPVASSFFDGLKETPLGWQELGKTMNAKRWRFFWYIRIPAALPKLASGLRIATVAAPIGAVIGEWVGASQGLGFLMLNANARMQIDLMFAALFVLMIFSLTLYFLMDKSLNWLVPWQKTQEPS
ncbi:MAG TPA: ABC transporter permease [Gammaproteobacteria bacterium]|nr:ABC transporter permease [Gammaproteobacteria bacterium]